MAKVDKITGEKIEKLRGRVDFYMLRGITPVARRWPKKPKPPYTPLQAEGMAVFTIARKSLSRISENMLEAWRKSTVGKKEAWPDVFTGLMMNYWKKYRCIAPIALDYKVVETELEFTVEWTGLRLYIDKTIPEVIRGETTVSIAKEDVLKMHKPMRFTFYDEEGTRLVAPSILLEIEAV
ncbi:hypothetical protein ES705_28891 [subsurface metagenome]